MSRRFLAWAGVVVLVACAAGLIGWRVHGGHWVRVETASMGTEAPVGTLLWVAPVDPGTLRPGDLITFRAPRTGVTYSHLVAAVHDDGTLSTRGRISAVDPWRLQPDAVIGKVVWRWPGVGWLVHAAPVLAVGGLIVLLLVRVVRRREYRLAVGLIGVAAVISAALVVYRPLTRAEQLAFVPVDGGARATYVSTGMLPVRLSAPDGDEVVLHDGEVGSVLTAADDLHGGRDRFTVTIRPAVPLSWWLAMIGACFLPAAGSLGRRKTHLPNGVPVSVRPITETVR